jgi:hypothetical protein
MAAQEARRLDWEQIEDSGNSACTISTSRNSAGRAVRKEIADIDGAKKTP